MALGKRILRSDVVQSIVCALAAFYIFIVRKTSRFEAVNEEIPQRFWDKNQPFILGFWHGRLLMMLYCWPRRGRNKKPMHMLISGHRDGQLISRTVRHFNISTVKGSSAKKGAADKGGAAAFRSLVALLKQGISVGITPDGPRGPYMQASSGAVQLARLSGVPIVPIGFSVKSGKHLKSWDRFLVPRPFTKGVYVWGDPLVIDKKDDVEERRAQLQEVLITLTQQADAEMGRTGGQNAAPKIEKTPPHV